MERWNLNTFREEGLQKSYDPNYLNELIKQGIHLNNSGLPVIYSLAHLANCSKTLYADLHAFASRSLTIEAPYRNFTIKKRSGGKRWISVPRAPLKAVQIWIAQEILNHISPHRAAAAYVAGQSNPLKISAEKHIGSKWVLKLDINNFFGNISEYQVYKVFKDNGYPKLLSFEMARLCTRITPRRHGKRWKNDNLILEQEDFPPNYGLQDTESEMLTKNLRKYKNIGAESTNLYQSRFIGSLPQGAPTSPALSNLVCLEMDTQLELLAQNSNATYTRYSDDLCFSFYDSDRNSVVQFKKMATKILWQHSFSENKKKTRIIPPGKRKILTGVVIDSGKTTIPKELRDRIRMHLHYAKINGIPVHCKHKEFRSVIGFRNHIQGLIMYVRSINELQGNNFLKEFNLLPWLEFEI
jgi:RNA-directed DNA polymerase